jgi:hypothetical protein
MELEGGALVKLVQDELVPQWTAEKERLDRIDRWARWDHDKPHAPRRSTTEYTQLADRAQAPWGDLIVGTIAQTLYVDGYRRADAPEDGSPWRTWQANGMDARQIPVHRAALTYGLSYGLALPGKTLTGEPMAQMRGVSPRQMMAFYEEIAVDLWPKYAMWVIPKKSQASVIRILDGMKVHTLDAPDGPGGKMDYKGADDHNAGVCPVVRFTNRFDLEGRSAGEIEPFIPLLGSIDQTKFDRLVVQRFASWIVRTIAGMSIDETVAATDESADQVKLRLKVSDLLVAKDPDTKFGSLPATPLDGFIAAYEADVKVLSAVSQTPAHEMLGTIANLSAEALAAADASKSAKSDEHKHTFGEAHEQWLRLTAWIQGDAEAAADFESQVRWKDTEIRSLSQAADALGKLATMLGVPVELLWEKIPGWTQQDVERAKTLLKTDDFAALVASLDRQAGDPAVA